MKKLTSSEEFILTQEFHQCPREIVLSIIYENLPLSEKVEELLEELHFVSVDFLGHWWQEKFYPTYYNNLHDKNFTEALNMYIKHVREYFPNFEGGIPIRKLTFTDKVPEAIQKRIKNFVKLRSEFSQEIIKKLSLSSQQVYSPSFGGK